MLPLLISLFVGFTASKEHRCIHDEMEHKPIDVVPQNYDRVIVDNAVSTQRKLIEDVGHSSEDNYEKIRIFAYWDYLDSTVSNVTIRTYLKELMTEAITYFEEFLYVKPILGPLCPFDGVNLRWTESNPMGDSFANANTYDTSKDCGNHVIVPQSHWVNEWQWDSYGVITPNSVTNHEGITNADLVLYISSDDTHCYGSTLAYASTCTQDQNGRSIAGAVNFCTNIYKDQEWLMDLTTTIHEITHVLGFSSSMYSSYKDSNGDPYSGTQPTDTISFNTDHLSITTPKVLSFAQQHFNCGTLTGVPLENLGGSGTINSHWDDRYTFNDFMNGVLRNPFQKTSRLTLNLLEDTGWYQVDYNYAEPYYWGKNEGCGWFNTLCLTAGNPPTINYIEYFQNDCLGANNVREGCYPGGFHRSVCSISNYGTITPSIFSYFTANPGYGGDALAEYCPIRSTRYGTTPPDFNYVCVDDRGNTLDPSRVYGKSSRCVKSIASSGWNAGSCYSHTCYGYHSMNDIWDGVIIDYDGNDINCTRADKMQYKTISGGSYDGYQIQCPNIDVICFGSQPFNCNFGYWNNALSQCVCRPGFEGTDCNTNKKDADTVSVLPGPTLATIPTVFTGTVCVSFSTFTALNGIWSYDGVFGVYSSWTFNGYYMYFDAWYHLWMISTTKGTRYSGTFTKYCSTGGYTQFITPDFCDGRWYNNPFPSLDTDMVLGLGTCKTEAPTNVPTNIPTTSIPTKVPTNIPTDVPTDPTTDPSKTPTKAPSDDPSKAPSKQPSKAPTDNPSKTPSKTPTDDPSKAPTDIPSDIPSQNPSAAPSKNPTSGPSNDPSKAPTQNPSDATSGPTRAPSNNPSKAPSDNPSETPTKTPTKTPTSSTSDPTRAPSDDPSKAPSDNPSETPTRVPTQNPTDSTSDPTKAPSDDPSKAPTNDPSETPTKAPTNDPSKAPTTANPTPATGDPSNSPTQTLVLESTQIMNATDLTMDDESTTSDVETTESDGKPKVTDKLADNVNIVYPNVYTIIGCLLVTFVALI